MANSLSNSHEYARQLYKELEIYEPFEKVASVFKLEDLIFLLTDTNSLKITYLSDHEDLPSGKKLYQWVEYGIIACHARLASKAGYTPKTLDEAIDLAASIGPEVSRQYWLEVLIKHPTTKRFLSSCVADGIDRPWLEAALSSGASLQLMRKVRKLEIPPRYLTKGIVNGCPDATSIQEWFNSGIEPPTSAQFIGVGLKAADALTWLQSGFIPSEIVDFVSAKKSIEQCKSQLPDVPYSGAFRRVTDSRFSMKGSYVERVRAAVGALDAPSGYQSSMFSSACSTTDFLDGGYESQSGYGFGSSSYTIIKGELALQFLCYRIGVRPPRYMVHTQTSLDQDSIEMKFREWRELELKRCLVEVE